MERLLKYEKYEPRDQYFDIANKIANKLIEQVQEFHDLTFVHLDLKPDNISTLQSKPDELNNLDITLKLIDVWMFKHKNEETLEQTSGSVLYQYPSFLTYMSYEHGVYNESRAGSSLNIFELFTPFINFDKNKEY